MGVRLELGRRSRATVHRPPGHSCRLMEAQEQDKEREACKAAQLVLKPADLSKMDSGGGIKWT